MIVHGNRFDQKLLDEFILEATNYAPPESSNSYLMIIDEFHRLSEKEQETLLHTVEDTPRTHFVLCTTNKEKISEGIKARLHDFLIAPPTLEQAHSNIKRIAKAEGIEVSDAQITEIARANSFIPRDCLKALQCCLVSRQN